MTTARNAWLGTCMLLHLAGCAGNGEGLDANGRPIEPGGGGALTPDLASIQAHVFTPLCTQCHAGAGAPQGLRLDAASSYGSLVGVPSSEVPALLRVQPGDPGRSYLVQKLEGRAAVGARMPLGQPPLPDATIQVIRQWITDGAPASATTPETILAVTSLDASSSRIAVGMTRSLDASLVSESNAVLEQLTADGAVPVPLHAAVSPHNDALLLLEPRARLASGSYRLTLRGEGAAALADWNARRLDGDRDGVPGGDYTVLLRVEVGR